MKEPNIKEPVIRDRAYGIRSWKNFRSSFSWALLKPTKVKPCETPKIIDARTPREAIYFLSTLLLLMFAWMTKVSELLDIG